MKLHIVSASGAGSTTLGQALAQHLNYPYFDSDSYFWEPSDPPFSVRREREERNQRITAALASTPDWVLGGSILNWGDTFRPVFDLVVFLWIPPALRLTRLRQRELTRYGTIIDTDPARRQQYLDFMAWAAAYDEPETTLSRRTLAAHEAWLATLACPVLELRADLTVAERVDRVLARMRTLDKNCFQISVAKRMVKQTIVS